MEAYNRILDMVKQEVEFRTGKVVPRPLVQNALLFTTSVIAQSRRAMVQAESGVKPINFFGITFAESGEGKDTSLDVCEEMYGRLLSMNPDNGERYIEKMKQEFMRLHNRLPTGEEMEAEGVIVPSRWFVSLSGSIQGAMQVANFYDHNSVGSLNVIASELSHDMNPETMGLLMKLWQSSKHEGSTNVNQKYPPVNNVPTNVLLFGTPYRFVDSKKHIEELTNVVIGGFGRRSIFVWEMLNDIQVIEEKQSTMEDLREYGDQVIDFCTSVGSRLIPIEDGANEILHKKKIQYAEIYNKLKRRVLRSMESSTDMIERLAGIIAMLTLSETITEEIMLQAIEIAEESFKSKEKAVTPQDKYRRIYAMLEHKMGEFVYMVEMEDEGISFFNTSERDFQLEKLYGLVHYNGYVVNEESNNTKLKINPRPRTDLDRIICSIGLTEDPNHPERTQCFAPKEIRFFGEIPSVEALVKSKDIYCFSLTHFAEDKNGCHKRNKKNAINEWNMVAFDVDGDMSLEEAMETLSEYTYIIYTTRNHRREKNGIVCDRFRILVPTKTTFQADEKTYKKIYKNLANFFRIPNDPATEDMARLWFTNAGAEVHTNDGQLLDIIPFIPETKAEVAVSNYIENHARFDNVGDRRIQGMIRWTLMNGTSGNRNNALMRLHRFILDATGSKDEADDTVRRTNEMFAEPLDSEELERTVCRPL